MPRGIYKRIKGVNCGLPTQGFPKGYSPLRHKFPKGNKFRFIDGRCDNAEYIDWQKNQRNRLRCKALGKHTFEEWEKVKRKYNYTCLCCKKSEPEIRLTEDHIVPISKNGSDDIGNIQPLCRICNAKKYNKVIDYTKLWNTL